MSESLRSGQDPPANRHRYRGDAPHSDVAERRRQAILAGYNGDEAIARRLLFDTEAVVRAAAVGALDRIGRLTDAELAEALGDIDASDRRRGLEILGAYGATDSCRVDLAAYVLPGLLEDADSSVVEVACWASGEHPGLAKVLVQGVTGVALNHDDPLCRESAVAALGALGHEKGRAAVLAGLPERAAIRRRAVLALAAFEGPEVEAALTAALSDRDWQVRQAAEDLLGVDGNPNEDQEPLANI